MTVANFKHYTGLCVDLVVDLVKQFTGITTAFVFIHSFIITPKQLNAKCICKMISVLSQNASDKDDCYQ